MFLTLSRVLRLLVVSAFLLLPRPAAAELLIVNGDFELGSLTGWTTATDNNGGFFISTPGGLTPPAPPSNTQFTTAANAQGGSFYAVSTADDISAHALIQNFTVPLNTPLVTLSFQMFVNDQSGLTSGDGAPFIDPTGLDPTTGGTFNNNQHARVDILTSGASDFSTAPADVVANLYIGVDNPGGALPNGYTDYFFNLLGIVTPGQTYRLRFADVNNLSALNVGVDNVQVLATPEPGTLVLFGLGALGLFAFHRRRQAG